MKVLEYEGKAILKAKGILVPDSYVASAIPRYLPVVLKSQVAVGGRGKAGGVIIVNDAQTYTATLKKIRALTIKGHKPKTILAEAVLNIDRELYLSLGINKSSAQVELMAHQNGGVEVEDNRYDSYYRQEMNGVTLPTIGQTLAGYYNLPSKAAILQELVEKLHRAFVGQDMTLCEINPLILTKTGELIAGDAKIVLDDAAHFRHLDWWLEEQTVDTNFVTLDAKGTVATIANGAGLAMATVDAVADAGMVPANFLDIGGGASEASVLAAFRRIAEYPNVRVIVVNIFAGITRCDEVAKAIIAARARIKHLPPLVIRMAGTNYEQAAELLEAEHIKLYQNLDSALAAAKTEL